MSILINNATKLVVQGITGQMARLHAGLMRDYGTQIVAGVRPGAGGTIVDGTPVFGSRKERDGFNDDLSMSVVTVGDDG